MTGTKSYEVKKSDSNRLAEGKYTFCAIYWRHLSLNTDGGMPVSFENALLNPEVLLNPRSKARDFRRHSPLDSAMLRMASSILYLT